MLRSDIVIRIVLICLTVGLVSACAARAAGSARDQVARDQSAQDYQMASSFSELWTPPIASASVSHREQERFNQFAGVIDDQDLSSKPKPPLLPPRILPSVALPVTTTVKRDANLEAATERAQADSPLAIPSTNTATSDPATPDVVSSDVVSSEEKPEERPSLYLASVANAGSPQPAPIDSSSAEPTPIVVFMPPASLLPTPTPTPVITNPPIVQPATPDEQPISGATVVAALTQPLQAPPTPQPTRPVAPPVSDGSSRTVRVPVLMYHYLSDPPPGTDIYRVDLSVSPAQFAAHLDAMQAEGYTTVSLYTLFAYLNQGDPLPDKPVILTFDDGYRDHYDNAFPILQAHNMQATFFVVTDFIDNQRPEYVTWDMAREMYAAGMSIESHGRNHISLRNKDSDYLIWQALGSLETIQHEIGVRPRFVSYPAGEYDQATIDIFQSANYWAGVTTIQGATHSNQDLFQMNRVRVRNSTTSSELLRLLALDW